MAKKILGFGLMLVFLAACSKVQPYKDAYTAKGDFQNVSTFERATVYSTTDNLQLVVELNEHYDELRLQVDWINPQGELVGSLVLDEITADTQRVYIDYDLAKAGREFWPVGLWQAQIRIETELVETLYFTVQASPEVLQTHNFIGS